MSKVIEKTGHIVLSLFLHITIIARFIRLFAKLLFKNTNFFELFL